MKRRIIICGYPKSGTTWLTRLAAEIVGCPGVGLWCLPGVYDGSMEGQERVSEFEVYKSHHDIGKLEGTFKYYANGSERIIYVVRDPRDIIVSASHFFSVPVRYPYLYRAVVPVPRGISLYKGLFHTDSYKLEWFMNEMILGGDKGSRWKSLGMSMLRAL